MKGKAGQVPRIRGWRELCKEELGHLCGGHARRGARYLFPCNPVNDFTQALVGLAGENPLQTQRPLPQSFAHTHVQMVVGLLGSQVLGQGERGLD